MAIHRINAIFASAQKGSDILTQQHDYFKRISPFDLQSKMHTNEDVSQEDLVKFMGENTLEWTPEEKEKVGKGIELFKTLSSDLSLSLPEDVFFVKTTGKEEGGAAYTHSNAIFFPEDFPKNSQKEIDWVVCHEFFHVLTRENPALREQLYQIIGFEKCGEIELPANVETHKISNPDAPVYDHVIKLQADGEDHWAYPLYIPKKNLTQPKTKHFLIT